MSPDAVNGLFEATGAAFLFLNVARLYRDKELKGIDWRAVAFFFCWGIWNLWFYPSAGLYWSFLGGIAIASMNCLWLGLAAYYWLETQLRAQAHADLKPLADLLISDAGTTGDRLVEKPCVLEPTR